MLLRMVIAVVLALGTGMAWSDPAVGGGTAAGLLYSTTSVSADSALQRGINFNGVVFPVDADVASDIDLTQADGVLYYQARADMLSLDMGLALRFMDGRVQMPAVDYARAVVFDGFVPLLYGRARLELPWLAPGHSMYAAAQAEGVSHSGDQLLDANLLLGWKSPTGVGIETGYRHYRLKLIEYDQLDRLDIDLSGPYAAVFLYF